MLAPSPSLSRRRALLAAGAAGASLMLAGKASSQAAFPHKPIELIVPFPPGSGSDIGARFYAEQLGRLSANPVTVRNIPGGNGFIAVSTVLRAEPDGHTVLIGANSVFVTNGVQFKKLPYDPVADFAMVGMLNRAPALLAVPGNSPHESLKSLVEAARASPGKLSSGYGATSYLMFAAQFYYLAGVQMNQVAFKGASEVATALASNVLDAGFIDPGSGLALAKANRLRLLAVAGDARSPQLPEVPSFKESGFADFSAYNWAAAAVPARTPPENLARLTGWFQTIRRAEATQAFFARSANEPGNVDGAELRRFQVAETRRWSDIATLINLQKE